MLKMGASGTRDGRPWHLVILGLSHLNLARLKDGQPIKFDGAEIGLPAFTEVVIYAGETEQAMAREMHEFIGPHTEVRIDPKFKT